MTTTAQLHDEATAYYALCERARALGIPTSLDDPCSPRTIGELAAAVAAATALAAITSALPFGA